jgi:hypothetical protein
MSRSLLCIASVILALVAAGLPAQEGIKKGKIKKIDAAAGSVVLTVGDKDLTFHVTPQTKMVGADNKELVNRLQSPELKAGRPVLFKPDQQGRKDILVGIKLIPEQQLPRADTSNLKPLNELGAMEYHSFKGGFYPDGKNERPAKHEAAGLTLAKQIQPLDGAGKPSPQGKIVLLSVGMSNTSQASNGFEKAIAGDNDINASFLLVNGAVGGMTAQAIQDPNDNGRGTKYWSEVDQRLKKAGVTRDQVQAIWIKEADAGPTQGFPKYAKTLEAELTRIVQLFPERFPNCKLVYLSSRTYGGYATKPLNPEPYAFESGFSVQWLIGEQIKGNPELNFDPKKGPVRAPWLSWGPYLWANGTVKRGDGFYYEPTDFADDGTHLSSAGVRKVGEHMLQFFKTDTTSRSWFTKAASR